MESKAFACLRTGGCPSVGVKRPSPSESGRRGKSFFCSIVEVIERQTILEQHKRHHMNQFELMANHGVLDYVLSFLHSADLAAAAEAYPPAKDMVRDLHHDPERQYGLMESRLKRCIHIFETATPNGDKPIECTDGWSIGIRDRVIIDFDDNDNWHDQEADLEGYHGSVVGWFQKNELTIVYVLLWDLYSFGPYVVVKGTTDSIIPHQFEEEEWSDMAIDWWEMPPRNEAESRPREQLEPGVDAEFWEEWKTSRAAIIRRAEEGRRWAYCDFGEWFNIKFIDITTQDEFEVLAD